MYEFLFRPVASFIGCCVVCSVNESSNLVCDCSMCSVFHLAVTQKCLNMDMKLVWLMKEENSMDNFFGFVYHVEENREYFQLYCIVEGS